METLPVEILHRIFDNLDVQTILFSVRSLSRLFQSVVNSYDRFSLDMRSMSKVHFHACYRLIKPENVISLILSNNKRTLDEIDLFIGNVRFLRHMTRLRSLNLYNIDERQLNFILKRINLHLLTSFSFSIRTYNHRYRTKTYNFLLKTLSHSRLHHFQFDGTYRILEKFSWPPVCIIQRLTINDSITINHLFTILQYSPHLHTVIIKRGFDTYHESNSILPSSGLTCFPQLRSFTMELVYVDINKLESFLMLTPSPTYLKLIGEGEMLDGKRWEQFIQINLPQLDKFEFFYQQSISYTRSLANIQLVIASFQTSFWIEHKKWFVTCECITESSRSIVLYSVPICKSSLEYQPESKKLVLSTCPVTSENKLISMNSVKSLFLTLNKCMANEIKQKKRPTIDPLFPNVTDINVKFWKNWPLFSLQSLSIFINIAQIVCMKLDSFYFNRYTKYTWHDIATFLKQAQNLSSLTILNSEYDSKFTETFNNLYSIIPCQLKHLQISLNTVDQLKQIINKCLILSTMQLNTSFASLDQILQWFKDNTIDSACQRHGRTLHVWLGKQNIPPTDLHIDNKRIKLTDAQSEPVT